MRIQQYEHRRAADAEWSALFVGDCLPSSDLLSDPLHEEVADIVSKATLAVANLEAPIESGTPVDKPGPVQSVPAATPSVLASEGFDIFTLANNHMMDHGEEGLQRTLSSCRDANSKTVGAGTNLEEALEPSTVSIEGTSVSIIALSQHWFSGGAEIDSAGVAQIDAPGVVRTISETASRTDVCVVVLHGGVGYCPLPSPAWREKVKTFVDLGADAVVCHHPHVAQGWETYRDAPIFYSLGNFLFPTSKPSTHWTCSARLNVSDGTIVSADVILTELDNGTVERMRPESDRLEHWQHLERLSGIVQSYRENRGYWQEVAVRLFDQRFDEIIKDYGCGPVQSLLRFPEQEAGRLFDGTYPGRDRQRDKQKQLLNQLEQDSFRNVITDALAVRAGVRTDERTDHIEAEVNELMRWVDQYPQPTRLETWRYRIRALYRNLTPT